jgi:uncharacterized coiled-coil DUF342 family protein
MSTKAAHLKELKAKLDEWRAALDRLEAEAREASADAEPRYKSQIAELRQKAEEAEKTLVKIQEGDEDAMRDLKQGAGNIWSAFKKNFAKAKSEFKRGYKEGMED